MNGMLKNIMIAVLAFALSFSPVCAKGSQKIIADMDNNFSIAANMPGEFKFKTIQKTVVEDVSIPQGALVTLEIIQSQKERRWHKSAFLVCKLKKYENGDNHEIVDLSDKNIYFVVQKYEALNKKDASIFTSELVLTQAASLFAPGVDILYYFTKGAIQREKNPNWFKAGVYNAYDNSICWFWFKGKSMDLTDDEQVQVKEIKEERADKLKNQIDRRKQKQARKIENKKARLDCKKQKMQMTIDESQSADKIKPAEDTKTAETFDAKTD